MNNRLHEAAADKNGLATVKEIVEQDKASINIPHSPFKTKPVAFAAQTGSVATVQYLVEQGADLDASAPKEKNLLEWAVQNTQEMVDYVTSPENKLIEKFRDGTTPFHASIAAGRIDEVREALNKTPSLIFQTNDKGITPFDWMYLASRHDIADLFINHVGYYILSEDCENENYLTCVNYLIFFAQDLRHMKEYTRAIDVMNRLITYCQAAEAEKEIMINLYCRLSLLHIDTDDLLLAQETYNLAVQIHIMDSASDEDSANVIVSNDTFTKVGLQLLLSKVAKERGFKCQDVRGDGACFYHALADQLSLHDGKFENLQQDQLRDMVVRHLTNNEALYLPFIQSEKPNAYESYLRSIGRKDYWVDHLAIQALSRELNATFVIVRSDGRKPDIIRQAQPKAILYFGYMTDLHYQSLHRLPNAEPRNELLESEIAAAEIDNFTGTLVGTTPDAGVGGTLSSTDCASLLAKMGHFSSSGSYSYSEDEEDEEEDEEETMAPVKKRKQ